MKEFCSFPPANSRLRTSWPKNCLGYPARSNLRSYRAGVPATLTVATATTELRRRLYDEITAWHWQTTAEPDCLLYLDSSGSPVDFFPYQPRHLPVERLQPAPDLNSAIVATLHQRNQDAIFQQKRNQLKKAIKKAITKAAKKQERQEAELAGAAEADTYRLYGELIQVHLHEIKRGQTELVVPNYYHPQAAAVTIPLDPALSPVANSQLYYKKYNKAKSGQEKIRAQLTRTKLELEYYSSLESSLANPLSLTDLSEIEAEMIEAGLLKRQSRSKPAANVPVCNRPSRFVSAGGWEILVGRNNKQNDQLTMKTAAPTIFGSIPKRSRSHVLIRPKGDQSPPMFYWRPPTWPFILAKPVVPVKFRVTIPKNATCANPAVHRPALLSIPATKPCT